MCTDLQLSDEGNTCKATFATPVRTADKSQKEQNPKLPPPEWLPNFPEVLKPLVLDTPVENEQQRQTLIDTLYEHRESFSLHGELGFTTTVTHSILTGDAAPIRQAPRRMALFAAGEAGKCMKEMKDGGFIQPCTAESEWASPIVLVRKKNDSWRFCVDFRKLNSVTKKSSHPLPRIEDTIDGLTGFEFFHLLDIRSAYYQIGLTPGDELKTIFVVPGYPPNHFTRMPFGLCGAPATFQALMNKILPVGKGGKLGKDGICFAYLDDIVVPAIDFEQGLERLATILRILREHNLKLHPKKCTHFKPRILFLGQCVSPDGVEANTAKTKAVLEWKTPTSQTQLRSFLGLCNYLKDFIPHYADLEEPLLSTN